MVDLAGKHIIVTGATSGIGQVSALELARMGATVILVSRSEARCKDTVDQIRAETNNPNVSYMAADLSDQEAVRQLAAAYREKFSRLDVLLNNAGAMFNTRKESIDGIEMTIALNHLSYFILTNELLDMLKETAATYGEARVVNVSSGAHQSPIQWNDIQLKKGYTGFGAYGQSKHMNVLFTYELARRLEGTGVTANVLHPGFVATRFGHNIGGVWTGMMKVIQRVGAKSPEEGAETSIYLASSPEVKGVTGKYFVDSKPTASSNATYDQSKWTRLWELSEAWTAVSKHLPA